MLECDDNYLVQLSFDDLVKTGLWLERCFISKLLFTLPLVPYFDKLFKVFSST